MRATELLEPDLAPYTDEQIRFAASAWPMRAAEELRSGLIFRALTRAAKKVGFAEPAHFSIAVRDEVRHAHLCAAVGRRLGADAPRYDARPVRARLGALPSPLGRLAALLLVEIAMGETISMWFFRIGHRAAVEPLTRAALGEIVADEASHQHLGWTSCEELWPNLDDARREALQLEATHALRAFEQQSAAPALRRLENNEPFDPAYAALGVLAPETRVEAFYAAVEEMVVPRLTRLGLDGARAWAERYRRTAG
jgi:hypothetical protein